MSINDQNYTAVSKIVVKWEKNVITIWSKRNLQVNGDTEPLGGQKVIIKIKYDKLHATEASCGL